jgi:hypothetical protein
MSSVIWPNGESTVIVPAGESVAVYAQSFAQVFQLGNYPNQPPVASLVGTVSAGGQSTFGPYTTGATLRIDGGAGLNFYAVGVAPVVTELRASQYQGDPVAVNVTGAVSALAIQGGIVTSTTAAAVAGTVPTGAVMDAAVQMSIGDSVDWSVINTGPNTFTVTAATDHTLVGSGAVATATSGLFRTRKTAANTFITYRLS